MFLSRLIFERITNAKLLVAAYLENATSSGIFLRELICCLQISYKYASCVNFDFLAHFCGNIV